MSIPRPEPIPAWCESCETTTAHTARAITQGKTMMCNDCSTIRAAVLVPAQEDKK